MKEKILALLIAKFAQARKDGLKQLAGVLALQCDTDEEASALVEKLTDDKVGDFIKDYRKDVDKEVSEGNKTYKASLAKKYNFVEKTTITEPGSDTNQNKDDISEQVKAAVAEILNPIKDELATIKSSRTNESRLQQLNERLSKCKDEAFKTKALKDFGRMKFDDDDSFNEYLTETETDVANANQAKADTDLSHGNNAPLFTEKETSGVSSAVQSYIDGQSNDSLGGKAL